MTRTRIRIENEHGVGYSTRVWLNDVEISASIDRLVVDVNDYVSVTLHLPYTAVSYTGEARIDHADPLADSRKETA